MTSNHLKTRDQKVGMVAVPVFAEPVSAELP